MEKFVDEINKRTRTSFKVTNIPVGLLKEFKSFCKEECGDVYWVGIHNLMKTKKQYEELLTLFHYLKTEIDSLKTQKDAKEVKTFSR